MITPLTFRSVYTWGTGKKGELGTGVCETQLDPVIIEGLKGKNIIQIVSGEYHSLALVGKLLVNSRIY